MNELPRGLEDKDREVLKETFKAFKAVKKVGRNEKCPCGSGKKFKRCCIDNSV